MSRHRLQGLPLRPQGSQFNSVRAELVTMLARLESHKFIPELPRYQNGHDPPARVDIAAVANSVLKVRMEANQERRAGNPRAMASNQSWQKTLAVGAYLVYLEKMCFLPPSLLGLNRQTLAREGMRLLKGISFEKRLVRLFGWYATTRQDVAAAVLKQIRRVALGHKNARENRHLQVHLDCLTRCIKDGAKTPRGHIAASELPPGNSNPELTLELQCSPAAFKPVDSKRPNKHPRSETNKEAKITQRPPKRARRKTNKLPLAEQSFEPTRTPLQLDQPWFEAQPSAFSLGQSRIEPPSQAFLGCRRLCVLRVCVCLVVYIHAVGIFHTHALSFRIGPAQGTRRTGHMPRISSS